MSDYTDAVLEGVFCQGCGEFMGDDGFAMFCGGCKRAGFDAPDPDASRRTALANLEYRCGGRRAFARFRNIVAASTEGRGVRWDLAPAIHDKLLAGGFITKAKSGRAWVSSKGMAEHRRANGD